MLAGTSRHPADLIDVLGLNNSYFRIPAGGTSSATPHVTGLIGLLLAYNPNLSISDVQRAVRDFARSDTTAAPGPHRCVGLDHVAAGRGQGPGRRQRLLEATGNRRSIRQRRPVGSG